MKPNVRIAWFDTGREPKVAPNPQYPDGIDIDGRPSPLSRGCKVGLAYPAPRCGYYRIICNICGLSVAVTTAGRPDDPRSITLPCKTH